MTNFRLIESSEGFVHTDSSNGESVSESFVTAEVPEFAEQISIPENPNGSEHSDSEHPSKTADGSSTRIIGKVASSTLR